MKKKFIASQNKCRLDKFLTEELKDFSRSKIQNLIKDGKVKINNTVIKKKHHWLEVGDKIELAISSLKSLPQRRRGENEFEKKIRIIKKTKDYLVLEKPAGLIVHGAENIREYSLVDCLKEKYPQIKKVGDDLKFRPGIVHRLDKKVSGLMVVALEQKMFENLKWQFQNRTTVKKYLALVHGQMTDNQGEINFPIARSKRSGKMVAKPENSDGKEALTLWEIKERFSHYTLLDVEIKTGRNHQIRAHFQAFNHPVVGDDLYQIKKIKDKFNLGRIFLHAYHLEFLDLNGELQNLEIELPLALKKVIEKLNNQ